MKLTLTLIIILAISLAGFSQTTNGVVVLPQPAFPAPNQTQQNAIAADSSGNIWVGYKYIGLGKFANGSWAIYDSINNGLLSNTVNALAVDANNNIWVGTKNGLQKFDGSIFQSFTTANSSLIDNQITTLFIKGTIIYIGTKAGVSIFNGSSWLSLTKANSNLISDTITAITVTTNNDIYIGTNKGLSCRTMFGNWITYDSTSAEMENYITALLADSNSVYIGTNLNTYKLYANTVLSFKYLFNCNDELNYPTSSFAKTSSGKIYFGIGTYPLYELYKGNFKKYFLNPSTGDNRYILTGKDSLYVICAAPLNYPNKFQKIELGLYVAPLANDSTKYIDINEVKALITNRGMMHWNWGAEPKYFVPKCSGLSSVYASALWLGGLDAGNHLHLAGQTYRQTGDDYFPGPIDTVTHVADTVSSVFYNKIWKLERNTINEFNHEFALGNVTNGTYVIPTDILTWPAQGILNNASNLAPFTDINNDGNYNPYDGDYPEIKGDQYLYWIFNDNLQPHTATINSPPLGVEIHAAAYAYACPQLNDSDAAINRTTFYQYKIINRSLENYHNMYIGLWSDMDLGFAIDDYVGCDTLLDIGFTYNGDNNDDGVDGYGLNPPMQNLAILKGPVAANADGKDNNHNGYIDETGETLGMTSFTSYNNVNGSINGNPYDTTGFYNYMKGLMTNGQPFVYATNGNSNVLKYMFPGTPYDTTQLTEQTVGNLPEDRRFIMGCGPFNLNANDTATIDFAYIFTRDESAPNGITTSVARNIKDVQKIINWYNVDSFPSCITITYPPIVPNVIQTNKLSVYPNPSKQYLQFSQPSLTSNARFYIYDVYGLVILSGLAQNKIINTINLSKGVYFLKVVDGNKVNVQRFIKM